MRNDKKSKKLSLYPLRQVRVEEGKTQRFGGHVHRRKKHENFHAILIYRNGTFKVI